MSPVIATFFCFVLYLLGYRFYARYLGRRLFDLDPTRQTPAHAMRDEVDYGVSRSRSNFGNGLS